MRHILVFATSVGTKEDVLKISSAMNRLFGVHNWTLDLDDCDNVLRVCSSYDATSEVLFSVRQMGFYCAILDD